jgi:tRNA threonylcarbamoyladenosine modification (KEOPS) complex  Pcc1 subunit
MQTETINIYQHSHMNIMKTKREVFLGVEAKDIDLMKLLIQ